MESVAGAEVTTLEGLGTPEKPHPIQKAFIDEQAAQCGFCLNGVILTAKALLDRSPKATDEQIRQGAVDSALPLLRPRPDACAPSGATRGRGRERSDGSSRSPARHLAPRLPEGSGALVVTFSAAGVAGEIWTRVGFGPGARTAGCAARFLDRDRRGRQRHRLHGQVRAGPGALHRAGAAHRGRARRAPRPRHSRPVRYGPDPGPGHHLGRAVPSRELQPSRTSPWPRRPRARRSCGSRPNDSARRRTSSRVTDGVVSVAGDPSKTVSYGSLVGGRTFSLALDPKARRRHPRDWTVLGQPTPRLDLPAMATGQFEFVHNVRLPGMLHGQVVRPPAVGATLVSVDETLGAGRAGPREGGRQEELRRRGRGEALAGPPGGGEAEGHLDERHRAARSAGTSTSTCGSSGPTRDTLLVDSKDVDDEAGARRDAS